MITGYGHRDQGDYGIVITHFGIVITDFGIVISDFDLPGFNGLRALALVREHDDDVPFFLVSGVIDEEQAVVAMKAGAQDYGRCCR